jgi:hypothetical protein
MIVFLNQDCKRILSLPGNGIRVELVASAVAYDSKHGLRVRARALKPELVGQRRISINEQKLNTAQIAPVIKQAIMLLMSTRHAPRGKAAGAG